MQVRDIYKHLAELNLNSYNLTAQLITVKIKADTFQLQNLLVTIPSIGFYHPEVNKDVSHLQTARKYNRIALQSSSSSNKERTANLCS